MKLANRRANIQPPVALSRALRAIGENLNPRALLQRLESLRYNVGVASPDGYNLYELTLFSPFPRHLRLVRLSCKRGLDALTVGTIFVTVSGHRGSRVLRNGTWRIKRSIRGARGTFTRESNAFEC